MAKTAKGLVDYCYAQLGNPYWYGTFGNIATASLLASKRKQYPNLYKQSNYKLKFEDQYGKRVHDCVGLIKGYLWSDTATSVPKYNSAQDVSANGMLGKCTKSGKISTMPDVPAVLVFMTGHVGVYVGGGYVIEARGHDSGVVKTALKGRGWTDWGYCPYIDYSDASSVSSSTSSTSSSTTNVNYFPAYKGSSKSLVDALKENGITSTFSNRAKIAKANGVSGYIGTSAQNLKLFSLYKRGKLIKP